MTRRRAPYRSRRSSRRCVSELKARSKPTNMATSASPIPIGSSSDILFQTPGGQFRLLEETVSDAEHRWRHVDTGVLDLRHEPRSHACRHDAANDFAVL